jgi:hypothetical protein
MMSSGVSLSFCVFPSLSFGRSRTFYFYFPKKKLAAAAAAAEKQIIISHNTI